ncbi:Ion transport protein-domain-containing protein [Pilobolus umbonatus]|nr:Ion transport protein-domain-containing protein [Pilobolus umbonatus]
MAIPSTSYGNDSNDTEQTPFMSTSKPTPEPKKLNRRYTQKKTPNLNEFTAEFEQIPRTPTYDTVLNEVEEPDYSDTARLTANVSAVSGFSHTQPRPYQPASIDPSLDQRQRQWKNLVYFTKKGSFRLLGKTIRNISRRVFPIQHYKQENTNTPSKPVYHDNDDDSQSIPMTPTSSHSSTEQPIHQPINAGPPKLYGYSLNIISPTHPIRLLLHSILRWRWIETIMMSLVITHGIVLMIVGWGTNPYPEPLSRWGERWDQYVIFGLFLCYTLMAILRIIVYGLLENSYNEKKMVYKAYLRHGWNRVDVVSILSYYVHFALLVTGQEIIGEHRRILVFKMLSSLVLLRLLNITDGNKVILNSLKKAAPLLVNVLFFVLFFFVIFGIIGVQSFKGSFRRHCVWRDPENPENVQELQQYCGGYINVTTGEAVPYLLKSGGSGLWSKGFICENGLTCEETLNPYGDTLSFDNIASSILLVMIITGVQSWTDRMYDMMDAEYFVASTYFVLIVIVMNFWLINLFIAVITEMFAKVREDSQHSAFSHSTAKPVLADGLEEDWQFSMNNTPHIAATAPTKSILQLMVVKLKPFWLLLVFADLIAMACRNNSMSVSELEALDLVETIFSLAFLVEIIIRIAAQRKRLLTFFKDRMNFTDFIIALVTCLIQIPAIRRHTLVYIWFTGFQVLRAYRLVIAIPRLRSLMSRVLGNVQGLVNLLFFILLAIILCAIISYQLFEGVINEDGEEMRFFSIYNSFVALYQLFSGEDWTTVLYNVMEAGSGNGNSAIYALYLVFWFACSNFVLVNMFIAVLMENFEIVEDDKRKRQVLHYMKKTEDVLDKTNVVNPWNIYRFFKPKPKGLDIKNIPYNLVLTVQKSIVQEFMSGAEADKKAEPVVPRQTNVEDPDKQTQSRFNHVRNFLGRLFPVPQPTTGLPDNSRISLDRSIAFDQVGTFYDFQKRGGVQDINEPRSLRYLVDPTLRETVANRLQETIVHDIEERRALRRDFIRGHPTYDKSLYLFSIRNPIRRWCQLIVQPSRGERLLGTQASRWKNVIFSTIITSCVIANVVLTIYNSPVYQFEHRDNPKAVRPFVYCDWAFTVIFSFEFLVKVIADGFFLTPNAYLLNGWNALDLFVLITLYMSNFGQFSSTTGLERAFRAFKALRALRLINLLVFAKETFTSILVVGLPRIVDAAALGLCLIIPFAIYGQNIFMGLFYMCNGGDLDKIDCLNEGFMEIQEPMPENSSIYMPRIWQNPYSYSFDSFWTSLLILFEIASGEGWVDVLTTSMSIRGKDLAPQQDASQLWGIFFMVYNLAGSVFVISLFLGVVIENFTKRNGSAYLTIDQRRWLDLKKLLNQIRPAKRPKVPPASTIRKWCYDLAVEKRGKFYKCMTIVITLNILFLCTDTVNDADTQSLILTGWNMAKVYIYLGFILIYWFEILIKLLGLGWKSFRRNLWNLFDLLTVIGSFISVMITLGNPSIKTNIEFQKLFMTALCFKLVQRSDGLNQLFTTMAASAYQIVNVFAVWFVALTTYAIMFMQIFGLTRYGPSSTTEHINFRTFSNTLISLVRYSTGEAWNSMMHDFTVESPNCVVSDNYLDSDCGSLRWAYFLFLTFNIISMYIFTAIFVAVVADNFSYVYQIKANFSLVNRDEIRKFKMTWASVDTDRDGYVKPKDYMTLWRKLDGIFTVRVFGPEYSYRNLVKTCNDGSLTTGKYSHHIDIELLNQKLSELDKTELHKRRRDLEKIYWETALIESTTKGVSFNQMLLMLAQRKLIIPENALILEELLEDQKKEEAIHTLSSIDRVRGLIETIVLRKKFLRYLDTKRHINRELPSIVIDNENNVIQMYGDTPISPMTDPNDINTISINIPHSTNSSVYDYYLSDGDEEDMNNDIDEDPHINEDILDNASHDLWKEILDDECTH